MHESPTCLLEPDVAASSNFCGPCQHPAQYRANGIEITLPVMVWSVARRSRFPKWELYFGVAVQRSVFTQQASFLIQLFLLSTLFNPNYFLRWLARSFSPPEAALQHAFSGVAPGITRAFELHHVTQYNGLLLQESSSGHGLPTMKCGADKPARSRSPIPVQMSYLH